MNDLLVKKHAGLYFLDFYNSEMEKLLKKGQANLSNHIQNTLMIKLPLKSVNPIVALKFPQYLRYSFIVLLVSFTESLLQEICIEVGKRDNLIEKEVIDIITGNVKVGKKKKGIIEMRKDFLKERMGKSYSNTTQQGFFRSIDELFSPILFLVIVRNCIVHSSGDVSKLAKSKQKKLQVAINKYPGFKIDNQLILLDEEFCKEATKKSGYLFSNLLTILN